ncbi:MAG TPA: hypothetical protein VGJ21_18670 [Terracidiphilus sp.]
MIDSTSLDSADAGSWHWKMDLAVYDFNGRNPRAGSIEVWRSDRNTRTVMTLEGAQLTTLRVGDKLYRSDGDGNKFLPLEAAFMQVLDPIPNSLLDPSVRLKLVERKLGKTKVDCVQPTLQMPELETYDNATGDRLDFCAIGGTDHFVVAYEANKTVLTIGQMGVFGSKQVPITFQISCDADRRVEGKTTTLSSFSPAPDEFAVTPDLRPLQLPVEVAMGALQSLMLVHEIPLPPMRGAVGQVKFDVRIGEDGRVVSHSLVEAASNPMLNLTVEKSLKHLILRPYLINGIAVQIHTAVSMNYSTGP